MKLLLGFLFCILFLNCLFSCNHTSLHRIFYFFSEMHSFIPEFPIKSSWFLGIFIVLPHRTTQKSGPDQPICKSATYSQQSCPTTYPRDVWQLMLPNWWLPHVTLSVHPILLNALSQCTGLFSSNTAKHWGLTPCYETLSKMTCPNSGQLFFTFFESYLPQALITHT